MSITKTGVFLCVWGLCMAACQNSTLVYQPRAQHEGVHMKFVVQSPAKVDILFVVDNSSSMKDEQEALTASVQRLLQGLKEQNTSFRVGVVSTDAQGFAQTCAGGEMSSVMSPVQGSTAASRGPCGAGVVLRYPHDGARGRLLAAYNPSVFNVNLYTSLNASQKEVLGRLFPSSASEGPALEGVQKGVRWVLDHDAMVQDACKACGCEACVLGTECYSTCADPVSDALFQAHFASNMQGLGVNGSGWEEGVRAGLWAVGVDAAEPDDAKAVQVPGSLLDANMPNTFDGVSWVREDAALAVMFVSDEEDCSMPSVLLDNRNTYEGARGKPSGSMCYQSDVRGQLHSVSRMAKLLAGRKKGVASRVVVGFIGGVRKNAEGVYEASDCVGAQPRSSTPVAECSCFFDEQTDARLPAWCEFSTLQNSTSTCQALAGRRYVDFAQRFTRHAFESICKNDASYFGDALSDFARLATFPCFDLSATGPSVLDSSAFYVTYVNKAEPGVEHVLQPTDAASNAKGFFYEPQGNRLCLTGLNRVLGDQYDVFMMLKEQVSFTE